MLEPLEHRGLWWLPEQPAERIAGVLTFSQDGARLELIGLLPRPEPEPDERGEVKLSMGPLWRPRILGLTVDGKLFTLEDCQATAFNISVPDPRESSRSR